MNRYALRVRQWWAVPLSLALVLVVCSAVGASEVPVPSLRSGMGSAQLAYFTPILIVVAVMYCLDRRLHDAEVTAVVPVRRLDQCAVVLTAILAHGAGLVVGLAIARNTLIVLALALLTRRVANEAMAAGAALLFLIANVLLGRSLTPDGHAAHAWWAVTLYPAGNPAAWIVSVASVAIALPLSFRQTATSR